MTLVPVWAPGRGERVRSRGLGAADAINYRKSDFEAEIMRLTQGRGVDVILDMVGGPVLGDNVRSLAIEGRLVNVARMGGAVAPLDLEQLWLKRLKLVGVTFRTRSEQERAKVRPLP